MDESPLAKIPRELRHQIYELVFSRPQRFHVSLYLQPPLPSRGNLNDGRRPELLSTTTSRPPIARTCRQLQHETMAYEFGEHVRHTYIFHASAFQQPRTMVSSTGRGGDRANIDFLAYQREWSRAFEKWYMELYRPPNARPMLIEIDFGTWDIKWHTGSYGGHLPSLRQTHPILQRITKFQDEIYCSLDVEFTSISQKYRIERVILPLQDHHKAFRMIEDVVRKQTKLFRATTTRRNSPPRKLLDIELDLQRCRSLLRRFVIANTISARNVF